ncbi:MAG TPA: SMP-30/gluconolactonase/LRE family protein [Ramlibacter sp.]|nr:SMP-30/gluconolactonase/LRE family protein [Ramlibacter sp.]
MDQPRGPERPETDPQAPAAPGGLGVLEKAMALLTILSERRAPMTFTELLRVGSLPKATLHRILNTLVREGLLRHDPHTRTYRLGFRLLELAYDVWSDFDLRLAAQDELVRLADELRETVRLSVLNGNRLMVVACETRSRDGQERTAVGMNLPLHASAAGKAVLAALERGVRAGLLGPAPWPRLTERTLADADGLQGELELTSVRGYALEDGESQPGGVAIAVPVYDFEGAVIGALDLVGPADRLQLERAHALSSRLISAARAISHSAAGKGMSISTEQRLASAVPTELTQVDVAPSLLGEGPVWSSRDNALYWVDILAPAIHSLHPLDGTSTVTRVGSMVSLAVPKTSGGLLLATPAGLMAFDGDRKRMTRFAHPEADRPGNRYNDGKCDRMGRLWIASMDLGTAPNRGSLFRVDPDGHWKRMDSGFTVPNGMGWSPDDSRMYFADTFRRTIFVYDFDLRAGKVANRRPLIEFDPARGKPDGLTVDEEGCLWVAMWDAWHVARFSPDGTELERLPLPVPRPTSCCFGGENLDTLYITTASVRLSESELAAAPLSGSLFAYRPGNLRGLPETAFAG